MRDDAQANTGPRDDPPDRWAGIGQESPAQPAHGGYPDPAPCSDVDTARRELAAALGLTPDTAFVPVAPELIGRAASYVRVELAHSAHGMAEFVITTLVTGLNGATVPLFMGEQEAHDVHCAIAVTVQLLEQVGAQPDAALTAESEERLTRVARRLDHERRHHGTVPNPNGPSE